MSRPATADPTPSAAYTGPVSPAVPVLGHPRGYAGLGGAEDHADRSHRQEQAAEAGQRAGARAPRPGGGPRASVRQGAAVRAERGLGGGRQDEGQDQRRGRRDHARHGAHQHGSDDERGLVDGALPGHRGGGVATPGPSRPCGHGGPAAARHRARLGVRQAHRGSSQRARAQSGGVADHEEGGEAEHLHQGRPEGDDPLTGMVGQHPDERTTDPAADAERRDGQSAGAVGAGAVGDVEQDPERQHRGGQPGGGGEDDERGVGARDQGAVAGARRAARGGGGTVAGGALHGFSGCGK